MKRILFITGSLASGGAERQMVTIAQHLHQKGFSVSFVCYSQNDFYESLLTQYDIPVHRILEYRNKIHLLFLMRRFIRRGNFNVVISFLSVPNLINCFTAIGHKSYKVITGERSSKMETFKTIKGRFFAWFQRFSDVIVCNSDNAVDLWNKYYPQYKHKYIQIYNTVRLGPINCDYVPKRDGKLHFVVAASFQYLKNPIKLAKAINRIDKRFRDLFVIDWYGRIDVANGNTEVYDITKNLIIKYGIGNTFILHDQTSDIANKMQESDVVALFSSVEGLPNTICEAMSIGKPILMSKVSDYAKLVDNTNGMVCECGDIISMSDSIISFLEKNQDELISMGHSSKNKAETLFNPNIIISKWEQILS